MPVNRKHMFRFPRTLALRCACALSLAVACGRPSPVLGQGAYGSSIRTEITAYDVQLILRPGGRLVVRENITVRGLGNAREWSGLVRMFSREPSSRYQIPFGQMEVQHNGNLHHWWSPVVTSGLRVSGIRIDYPDPLPPPGVHRFTLRYVTQPWIAQGPDGNHLEWSVTGDRWGFPIREVTADIRLPGYDLCAEGDEESGSIRWKVSGTWRDDAGCTISTGPVERARSVDLSITLPEGKVPGHPAIRRRVVELVTYLDWAPYMDGELILALIFAIFALLWLRVGRGPEEGTLVTEYGPPDDLSPAVLGYLRAEECTDTCLTAAVIDLAVKGVIRIEERGGRWHLVKTGENEEAASAEERSAIRWIMGSTEEVTLPRPEGVRRAARIMQASLDERLRPNFQRNLQWFALGLLASVAGFGFLVWKVRSTLSLRGLPLGVLYVVGTAILVPKLLDVVGRWRQVLALGRSIRLRPLVLPTLALTPFLLLLGMLGLSLRKQFAGHLIVAAMALVVLNVLFYRWLASPSIGGRLLLDRVTGFRHFLETTAVDRLNRLIQPHTTLEERDPLLPYAVALNVNVHWAEAFSDALHYAPGPEGGGAAASAGRGGPKTETIT